MLVWPEICEQLSDDCEPHSSDSSSSWQQKSSLVLMMVNNGNYDKMLNNLYPAWFVSQISQCVPPVNILDSIIWKFRDKLEAKWSQQMAGCDPQLRFLWLSPTITLMEYEHCCFLIWFSRQRFKLVSLQNIVLASFTTQQTYSVYCVGLLTFTVWKSPFVMLDRIHQSVHWFCDRGGVVSLRWFSQR